MVLSYLRMEDMGNDLKFQWYPIGDIMRQAVRKYSQIFILKKIHLNFQDSRQMVLTDEKWLLFVIEQILSNALKYTSSDEVRPPKAGSISLYIKGTELVVEDTGIGIAPEDLPRNFERGFTGYNGREHQKSTGIGLYLCKTIIQKLGHSIRAQSRVGVGTKILSNALKYTSSDEVRPPKAGSISLYIKGTELVVEDTGIGIAPEDLPRIFERGFTGYNGREHQKSTGIGLYLCKTIIQKLGHSIRAESRVGVGTKIYISLEREDVKFE